MLVGFLVFEALLVLCRGAAQRETAPVQSGSPLLQGEAGLTMARCASSHITHVARLVRQTPIARAARLSGRGGRIQLKLRPGFRIIFGHPCASW